MHKIIILIILTCFVSIGAYSQTSPLWEWKKDYNGTMKGIVYHNDNLYTIGTYSDSSTQIGSFLFQNIGGKDSYIAKWDTMGNVIWAANISDTGYQDILSIHVNSNNEIVVLGNNSKPDLIIGNDTINTGLSNGAFIATFDSNGNAIQAFGIPNCKAFDFCIDNLNNLYISTDSGLYKFNEMGTLLWYKSAIKLEKICYAPNGNCLLGAGSFQDTLTIDWQSIYSVYWPGYYHYIDLFCLKLDISGNTIWLQNLTESDHGGDLLYHLYYNEWNDKAYFAVNKGTLNGTFTIYEVEQLGNISQIPFHITSPGLQLPDISGAVNYPYAFRGLSGKDSIISYSFNKMDAEFIGFFDLNTHKTFKFYYTQQGGVHLTRSINAIYSQGTNFSWYSGLSTSDNSKHAFGKFGHDALSVSGTNYSYNICSGSSTNINASVTGGTPPLNYSWSPSVGLSNTNSNIVSCNVGVSTTYTVSVTDANGQSITKPFTIIVENPLSPVTITPQYGAFCLDSMYLAVNSTTHNGNWQKMIGSYWNYIIPIIHGDTGIIYSPGLYRYQTSNSCGVVEDTITIQQIAPFVTASASTILLCEGDSLILTGGGANTSLYTWSGGALNNTAFPATTSQHYIVRGMNADGCADSASVWVSVNPLPNLSNISATPSIVCSQGNSILSVGIQEQYCTPQMNQVGATGDYISNVNFGVGVINNSTNDNPLDYEFYPTPTASVNAGSTYPISITVMSSSPNYKLVWIDFNQDGDFDDGNELVFNQSSSSNLATGNIIIPSVAMNGQTRMRVGCDDNMFVLPCNGGTGEYEDYSIVISNGLDHVTWSPSTFLSNTIGNSVQVNNIDTTTTYTASVVSAAGCVNHANVTIQVNPIVVSTSNINMTICTTDLPYVWNTQVLTSSGTYTASFMNVSGCDSIVILNLTVNTASSSTTNTTICSSDLPYLWNTLSINSSGTYSDYFLNTSGCDSTAILNLTVNSTSTSSTNSIICSSDIPYAWNTQILTSSGVYTTTLSNASGCDSIATLNLIVNQSNISTMDTTICSTALPYVWNSQNLTTSGVYTMSLVNSSGCDSIATLNLTVISTSGSTTDTTICSTDLPFVWNTQSLTTSGYYTSQFTNVLGCDSISTLNLTVNQSSASTTNASVCVTALPYTWNSQTYTATGIYASVFTNSVGCDSISILDLIVNTLSTSNTNTTICSTALPYIWNSQSLISSGIYTANLINSQGCDSIATLNLTVNPTSASTTNVTICSTSLPFVWNTQSLTTSGTYTSTFTDALGCDSIATLNLTVNPSSASTTDVTICSTTLPYVWNTQSLTASGVYTSTFTNAVGCDSVATLNLTVNPTSTSTTNTTICSSSLPYVWNSQSLTSTGIYTSTFINAFGCDSIATLNFTVNPIPIVTIIPGSDSTICIGASYILEVDNLFASYAWSLNSSSISSVNTVAITDSGTYIVSCVDSNGCIGYDSVHIYMNPIPDPLIIQSNDTLICTNANNMSYLWHFNGANIGTDSALIITQNGVYYVKVTDSIGCIGFDTLAVIGLGMYDISSSGGILIYPNPSSDFITIEMMVKESGQCTIQLLDATGKIVAELIHAETLNQGSFKRKFDLASYHLSQGVYILSGKLNGNNWTKRITYSY